MTVLEKMIQDRKNAEHALDPNAFPRPYLHIEKKLPEGYAPTLLEALKAYHTAMKESGLYIDYQEEFEGADAAIKQAESQP